MLHKAEIAHRPFELAETKYSTGRFHLMDVVVRRWSSLIQETLYERIGVMFDVSVQNVEQHRFEEFFNSISKQPIYIFETHNQSRGLFLVDNAFFNVYVLKSYSEEVANDPEGEHTNGGFVGGLYDSIKKEVTSLESKLVNGKVLNRHSLVQLMREHQRSLLALVRPMINDFERSWLNIAQVELNLNRVTIYPYRAKVMLPYEYCLVFCIKLSSGKFNSNFTLCLPMTGVDSLLTPIEKKKLIEPESMEYYFPHVKKHFNDLLDDMEYSVVAELGTTDLSGTHGKLEEGQVLPLENRDGNVTIRINGTPVLKGATGESDGNYSVRVVRGIDDRKPSSIQQNREFKQAAWAEN